MVQPALGPVKRRSGRLLLNQPQGVGWLSPEPDLRGRGSERRGFLPKVTQRDLHLAPSDVQVRSTSYYPMWRWQRWEFAPSPGRVGGILVHKHPCPFLISSEDPGFSRDEIRPSSSPVARAL